LWAFARYDLQIPTEEYLDMTFREFYALSDRCKQVRDWVNSHTAMVCTMMFNLWRGPKTPPAKVEDFMPGKHESKEQTPEQMLAIVRMLNAAHGGNISEN